MRRDNTNPSKVSSGWGVFEVGEDAPKNLNVSAVPLPDTTAIAVGTGYTPDFPRAVVMVNREMGVTGIWFRDRLEADGALSTL